MGKDVWSTWRTGATPHAVLSSPRDDAGWTRRDVGGTSPGTTPDVPAGRLLTWAAGDQLLHVARRLRGAAGKHCWTVVDEQSAAPCRGLAGGHPVAQVRREGAELPGALLA